MTTDGPGPPASGLERLVEQAREDLARRLPATPGHIVLVEVSEMTWPDSSIGCPQPGMAYLQVRADGARIVLEADGRRYAYHYGGRRGLFLCEKGASR